MISSEQAKQARGFCGLAQSRVVKDTGINRSYLSKYENGHRNLSDADVETLEEYYKKYGWNPEVAIGASQENTEQNVSIYRPFFREGIQIPDNFDEEYAEALLDELIENDDFIQKQLAVQTKTVKGEFLGPGRITKVNDLVRQIANRMARNYCIVRELHGQDCLLVTPQFKNATNVENGDEILPTLGSYLGFQFKDWDFQEQLEGHEKSNMLSEVEPVA